jgi:rubrerythrin
MIRAPSREDGELQVGDDFVELLAAGSASKGEFHCAECGYGVTITRTLPTCPMCSGSSWQRSDWSPLGRARQQARIGS